MPLFAVVNGVDKLGFNVRASRISKLRAKVGLVIGFGFVVGYDDADRPIAAGRPMHIQLRVYCGVACDIAVARESARTPMPGGWHRESNDSEYISQLYDNAAAIAAVRTGIVHESYAQVQQSYSNPIILFY